jgi:hypothetical protein
MDKWSVHRRDLNLTRHNSHTTDTHVPVGIRTHNNSKQTAADPHIRPRGHWDQPFWHLVDTKYSSGLSFRVPLHNSSKSLSAVYKVWIWRKKDRLGARIYNVRKRRVYKSRMSESQGPPVQRKCNSNNHSYWCLLYFVIKWHLITTE